MVLSMSGASGVHQQAPFARRALCAAFLAATTAVLVGPRSAAAVQPTYGIVTLPGLTDAEHTDGFGLRVSDPLAIDGTGRVFGSSQRFLAGATEPTWHGVTGWVYDPISGETTRAALDAIPYAPPDQGFSNGVDQTTNSAFGLGGTSRIDSAFPRFVWAYDSRDGAKTLLGLSSPDHANPIDGSTFNRLSPYPERRITSTGFIAGMTTRWLPAPGESAWLYDSTTRSTSRIGLFDAAHVASDGTQYSEVVHLAEAGNVAGHSERYLGSSYAGRSAWIHRASTGTTARVGLYDGDGHGSQGFTRADGHQESQVSILTGHAFAAGTSQRFAGAEPNGLVAWRYRLADESLLLLGLDDPMHTHADGSRTSEPLFATDSGHVGGASSRYGGGSTPLGSTAWILDAGTLATTPIGLHDADHTTAAGEARSSLYALTETGYAAGTAQRFAPHESGVPASWSVWVARAGDHASARVGLVDTTTIGSASFTSSTGEQDSALFALFDSGDAIGVSLAYSADTPFATAAWYYDASAATTRPIGLYGPGYTAPDGSFASGITHWTATGFVVGWSTRTDGFPGLWIYSNATDQLAVIAPPQPSIGGVHPTVDFVSPDGLVLGRFAFFVDSPPFVVERLFAWTWIGGTVYLDERISGGLSAAGWDQIETIRSIHDGRILGSGRRSNGDRGAFMLVPLPEPSRGLLIAVGGLAVAWMARGRRPVGDRNSGGWGNALG